MCFWHLKQLKSIKINALIVPCLGMKEWVSQESKVSHHSKWTFLWCRLLSSGTQFTLDTYREVLSALCLN